jgi:hypothetical protein
VEVDAKPNNKAQCELVSEMLKEATKSVEPNEEENVNLMSDEDFLTNYGRNIVADRGQLSILLSKIN